MLSKNELNELFMIRLEQFREEKGMSQGKLADSLGMSLSAYKRLLNKESNKVDLYIIYKLYKVFGRYAIEFISAGDDQINRIVSKLRVLNQNQIDFIEAVINFESQYKPSETESSDDLIDVLVLSGDMEDGMIYDTTDIQKVHIGSYSHLYKDKVLVGIKITSNHLHPAYNYGDIILIGKEPIRDGDTGVFINKNTNRAYLRKFRQTSPCRLDPINDYGDTIFVDPYDKDDMDVWIKFGKVISKIRI